MENIYPLSETEKNLLLFIRQVRKHPIEERKFIMNRFYEELKNKGMSANGLKVIDDLREYLVNAI